MILFGKWNTWSIKARLSSDISRFFSWFYYHITCTEYWWVPAPRSVRRFAVLALCSVCEAELWRVWNDTLCGDSRGILPKSFCHFLSRCFILIASFYWPTQSFVLDFDTKTPSVYKAFVCTTCLLRGLLLVSSCSCRSLAAIARAWNVSRIAALGGLKRDEISIYIL